MKIALIVLRVTTLLSTSRAFVVQHRQFNGHVQPVQQQPQKLTNNEVGAITNTCLFESKKGSIQVSTPEMPSDLSPTSILDYILSLVTSEASSILLGSVGILLALSNRLSSIDYEASSIAINQAADMGSQSRMDLLAVFSAGAVLLNGLSKLDVTSALAETVQLEGTALDATVYVDETLRGKGSLEWALKAVIKSTPAKSSVILGYSSIDEKWNVCAVDGITHLKENSLKDILDDIPTPILNRFLKDGQGNKESYLPTLQALPGKSEVTYLPENTQEVLMLPIDVDGNYLYQKAALVLGSDTAKSFSPKDVAWCQVLASRLGNSWSK